MGIAGFLDAPLLVTRLFEIVTGGKIMLTHLQKTGLSAVLFLALCSTASLSLGKTPEESPSPSSSSGPETFNVIPGDWKLVDPAQSQARKALQQSNSSGPGTDNAVNAVSTAVSNVMYLTGHYFDPAKSGDGFDVMVVDQGGNPRIVVFFYGYDVDGRRLWLISDLITPDSSGNFSNKKMYIATGNDLDLEGAGDYQLLEWGRLDLTTNGCGSATFTLKPTGKQSKVMNATQLTDIPGPGCLVAAPRPFQSIGGLSGSWFKQSEAGDGFNIRTANAGLVVFFYGYDSQGRPLWLLNSIPYRGPILPGMELQFDMVNGSGGTLYDVSGASLSNWGSLTLTFEDCETAEARLEGNDGVKSVSLVQLARVAGTLCEAPGTIELNQPTITFDKLGDKRTVQAVVRDGQGSLVSSPSLEVDVQNTAVAKVNSVISGQVELEASTSATNSTVASFWDPPTNSVQEAEVNVVDFQPNVIEIPAGDVISGAGKFPVKGGTTEVVLARTALTESLTVGRYIWVAGNILYGRVNSKQIEPGSVRIQMGYVSLPVILLNLNLSSESLVSSAAQSGPVPTGNSGQSNPQNRGFGKQKLAANITDIQCTGAGVTLSPGAVTANVALYQPGGAVNRNYTIVNGVPSPSSSIDAQIRLSGEVDIRLPGSVPENTSIHCEIMNYVLQTPAVSLWGPYSGGVNYPVNIAVDFNVQDQPPNPLLKFNWAVTLQFNYNFASQALSTNVVEGLAGGRVAELGYQGLANVPNGSGVSVVPSFNGPLGLYGTLAGGESTEMEFVNASVDFPYEMNFFGPEDIYDLFFTGPDYLFSIGATGQQNVDASSPLLDPLGFDTPNLPDVNIFGPEEAVLLAPPEFELTPDPCGDNCGVDDARTFVIRLSRPGSSERYVRGEVQLYAVAPSGLVKQNAFVFSGNTPSSGRFELSPDEAGTWDLLARFESWDDGAVYGGPNAGASLVVDAESNSCTLNVIKSGSGRINSSPSGISCGSDCSQEYSPGQHVTLTASPSDGWFLDSWSNNCAVNNPQQVQSVGDSVVQAENNTCEIVMECDQTVTAEFVEFQGQDGDPRINLVWNNTDDLDLHCIDPCGQEIAWNSRSRTCNGYTGELDVDSNAANAGSPTTNPAENIVWINGGPTGQYQCWVVNYPTNRNSGSTPFTLRLNYGGEEEVKTGSLSDEQSSTHYIFNLGGD